LLAVIIQTFSAGCIVYAGRVTHFHFV